MINDKQVEIIYDTIQRSVYRFPEQCPEMPNAFAITNDLYLGLRRFKQLYDPLNKNDYEAAHRWNMCRCNLQDSIFDGEYIIDANLMKNVIYDNFDSMMLIAVIARYPNNADELLDKTNQLLEKAHRITQWQIDSMFYDLEKCYIVSIYCRNIARELNNPKIYEYINKYCNKISNIIEFCLRVTERFIEKYKESNDNIKNNIVRRAESRSGRNPSNLYNYFIDVIVRLMTIFVHKKIKINILKKVQITEMLESLNEIYPDYVR